MQCRYGTGEAAVWLTGMPYREDVGPLPVTGRAQVQVEALVRAATPFVAGRGNKAVTLPVPIVLQFDNWMSALRYTHEQFWQLPAAGELYFVEQWGADKVEITYPKAAVQVSEMRRREATVTINYEFVVTGPPAFVVTSDAPLRIITETGDDLTT